MKTEDQELTEAPEKEVKKTRGRKKTEQKAKLFDFEVDNTCAVVVKCSYSKRREVAERLFTEYAGDDGLTLTVPACGVSIRYEDADRIPTTSRIRCLCGNNKHQIIRWQEDE
jgi:hypothetical protein